MTNGRRTQTFTYYEHGRRRTTTRSDVGDPVEDSSGRVTGTRGYTQFNSSAPVPVTHHSDGGMTVHGGGPSGDLYVDRNGET